MEKVVYWNLLLEQLDQGNLLLDVWQSPNRQWCVKWIGFAENVPLHILFFPFLNFSRTHFGWLDQGIPPQTIMPQVDWLRGKCPHCIFHIFSFCFSTFNFFAESVLNTYFRDSSKENRTHLWNPKPRQWCIQWTGFSDNDFTPYILSFLFNLFGPTPILASKMGIKSESGCWSYFWNILQKEWRGCNI